MLELFDNYKKALKPASVVDDGVLHDLKLLLEIDADKNFLDLFCGSGHYTTRLQKLGGQWVGFDFPDKLDSKDTEDSNVAWHSGQLNDAFEMERRFDGVLCRLHLHEIQSLGSIFSPLRKVLIESGKLVLFTASPRQIQRYWLWQYFPGMMEGFCSRLPGLAEIDQALADASMRIAKIKPFWVPHDACDTLLYCGKQRPELYLSPQIRAKLFPFQELVSEEELESGLSQLADDIASGQIMSIMQRYDSDGGDYMTIQAEFEL